jgi:hypothetical protein
MICGSTANRMNTNGNNATVEDDVGQQPLPNPASR